MRMIILASASPRRKALLEQIGLKFTVDARVQEDTKSAGQEPHQMAREISLKKVESVAGKYPDAIIIGADTFGVIDGRIIGKPHSESEARTMLASLSGKSHSVITGFTVLDTLTGKAVSRSVETTVYIRRITASEIEAYIKTGEPLDKAGSYAIQGLGAVLVEKIEGDYFNVMGLPLAALAEALKEFGVNVL
ncbi:MAG: Maf family protein [Chloroflexota bacterium]